MVSCITIVALPERRRAQEVLEVPSRPGAAMVAVHEREFDVATLPGEVLEDPWEEFVAVTDVEGDVGERGRSTSDRRSNAWTSAL